MRVRGVSTKRMSGERPPTSASSPCQRRHAGSATLPATSSGSPRLRPSGLVLSCRMGSGVRCSAAASGSEPRMSSSSWFRSSRHTRTPYVASRGITGASPHPAPFRYPRGIVLPSTDAPQHHLPLRRRARDRDRRRRRRRHVRRHSAPSPRRGSRDHRARAQRCRLLRQLRAAVPRLGRDRRPIGPRAAGPRAPRGAGSASMRACAARWWRSTGTRSASPCARPTAGPSTPSATTSWCSPRERPRAFPATSRRMPRSTRCARSTTSTPSWPRRHRSPLGSPVVVVGGGYIGLEMADNLRRRGLRHDDRAARHPAARRSRPRDGGTARRPRRGAGRGAAVRPIRDARGRARRRARRWRPPRRAPRDRGDGRRARVAART